MRKEEDSLGQISVEKDKLWGASTQRTLNNFSVGKEKMPIEIIYAFAMIKKAAAVANFKLKVLSKEKCNLIVSAADEILLGKYDDHFPLKIWQTGSGTATNMNVNEVICNIASLKAKKSLGSKDPVHPNDDVNMGQSSNDTFPSAMHIATLLLVKKKLLPALEAFKAGFDEKAEEFKDIIKVGRTHLMDAVPITLGQEFKAFSSSISEAIENIKYSLNKLYKLPLGATAVGTGVNTHKDFATLAILEIGKMTSEKFYQAENLFQPLAFSDGICNMSSSLKQLGISLIKIANDLSLLSSGPRCGIGEIILPAIEPGSSIMPGKINPSQCESLKMVAMQVVSNDTVISLANASGFLQLNVAKPVKIYSLIQSIELLTDMTKSFLMHCLKGIKPNLSKIQENLDKNLMLATILNKAIGYEKAAQIVFKAFNENKTLKQAAIELKLLDEKSFDEIVNPKKMLKPYE
jgi:fumarate hydratase, class II